MPSTAFAVGGILIKGDKIMKFTIKRKPINIICTGTIIERYLVTDEQVENFKRDFPKVRAFIGEDIEISISQEEFNQMLKEFLESKGVKF